jgi:hypothetical protein
VTVRKPVLGSLGLFAALIAVLVAPTVAQADFGIQNLRAGAVNRDGSVATGAGTHPYGWTVSFEINQNSEGEPEGKIRDLIVDLPVGMVGNPTALPACAGAEFEGFLTACPPNTQIGVARVKTLELATLIVPVYNLAPPLGVPASVGFSLASENSLQEASLRSGDYGVTVSDTTVPTSKRIVSVSETIWGVPAASNHDAERGLEAAEGVGPPVPSGIVPKPFLTLPTSCTGPLKTTVSADSLEEPGVFRSQTVESLGETGLPEGLSGCDRLPFNPSISSQPETTGADSPTGLDFNLHLPQTDLPSNGDPEGRSTATADLQDAVVTLPPGLAFDPSAADGLSACSPAQIELGGPNAPQCPPSSKVGTIEAETPLLAHPVPGTIYVARQVENPFGSLIAIYLVLEDPDSGVLVKIPGKVDPDPVTGQLRATVPQNPQLPVEDISLHFSGGPRGVLTTPATCGSYATHSELTPWTSPEGLTAFPVDSFKVDSGAGGSPCPSSEAAAPNNPTFEAGTVTPLAGSYSPFVLKLSRENGSQRISSLSATLPEGLVGKLAGVPYCTDLAIAAAVARDHFGDGALEQANPSCPPASEVGTVVVGAGSGSPLYVAGHAYLAGPYKGAPLSLEVITPAVAGPFDLGVVAVRAALFVDDSTSQIHAISDPLPSILDGIPLDIRSVALNMSRPQFTLNPTSCQAAAITGSVTSTTGQTAPLSNRFQVGGCKGLAFTPKLSLTLKGSTRRGGNPALRAVLTQPKGEANIAKVSVVLPRSEFIDNRHINSPCTRVQFNAGAGNGAQCPAKSILGHARAFTPLLDKPLEGPVYFRSNGGERELPDLVASLDGQVHLNLVGFIDSVHSKGSEISRTRNTFATVPDAPVSRFVLNLKGGKEGLLQNSANLCKVKNIATVKLNAQNGKMAELRPKLANGCGKPR